MRTSLAGCGKKNRVGTGALACPAGRSPAAFFNAPKKQMRLRNRTLETCRVISKRIAFSLMLYRLAVRRKSSSVKLR